MKSTQKATQKITINASKRKVWKALTEPAQIKEYLFGTNAESDWKKGSSITYKGEWEGKHYEDKGFIIDIQPEKLLHTTYYSPFSGKKDIPENYANVIYKLSGEAGKTTLTVSQDNLKNDKDCEQCKKNWKMVLANLKKFLEK